MNGSIATIDKILSNIKEGTISPDTGQQPFARGPGFAAQQDTLYGYMQLLFTRSTGTQICSNSSCVADAVKDAKNGIPICS